jgi:predicted nuclease of restriction endonuclease-like (RecB) superfamily
MTMATHMAQEFGRGFEAKNLRRMMQFALAFPDTEKVASLMRHLSWTHFLQLLPLKTEAAHWFYAQQCVESHWSVRELHHQIERKAFERTELAAMQANTPVQAEPVEAQSTPALVFKDPYFLDFLDLRQGHDEADLEAAILRQLEAFILELGRFKAAHKGQMELYLKWLDKHERQAGEEAPIVLILCAESSREQVELLQMHKDGITVAEY